MAKAKKIEGLDCGGDARSGVGLVLLARLGEMCEFREAALDWSDPEGVHDMRVASRRLRSALRDFLPHLNRRGRFEEARDELRRLAGALGEVRDEDVALIELEKLKAEAPPEARPGLERLVGERAARREEARARLSEALTEEALAEFRQLFQEAVEAATRKRRRRKKQGADGDANADAAGGPSFRTVGRTVILRSLDELAELSPSLYRPRKTKRLHRMRIAAKRLRYALELFAPCWEGETKAFAEEVAELQGALGELHDCDVWIEECGARLAGKGDAGKKDGEAVGDETRAQSKAAGVWLLGHFAEARACHYRQALVLRHEWERGDFAARLVACLEAD